MNMLRVTIEARLAACAMIYNGMRENNLNMTREGVALHIDSARAAAKFRY
jgi:hypothetical protein